MKKSKIIGVIVGVVLFVTMIAGLTYAYVAWSSQNINKQVSSKCFNVLYDKGSDIIGTITPSYDYTGGLSTIIRMNMSSECGVQAKGILYLYTSTDTSENLFREGLLNYYVVRNGNAVIASGNITESGQIAIDLGNIAHSQTAFTRYEIYIWLNYNLIENADINSLYYGNIKAVAVQSEGDYTSDTSVRLIDYITNLYANNTLIQITQANSGDKYYYSDAEQLMNDGFDSTGQIIDDNNLLRTGTQGNIRYYGNNPNNYIYFNCDDYANQSSSTCELWRIIGIIDGKVKIMRNESIGSYSWDYPLDNSSSNWHIADLNNLLNNSYYNNVDEVSYNNNGTEITINFASDNIGLKNDDTRNLISESTWYLGGSEGSTARIYPSARYIAERGTGKCTSCTYDTTWIGNIGLMYSSDYGYAGDLSQCGAQFLNYYTSENLACRTNNWMFSSSDNKWTISPYSLQYAWSSRTNGQMALDKKSNELFAVHPTLYLDPTLEVNLEGYGTTDAPYQIIVK